MKGWKEMNTNFAGGSTFILPTDKAFILLATVLTVGVVGCLAIILSAVIAVAYLLNLTISAVCELVTHLSLVYNQGDSLVKLLCWVIIAFLLTKIWPSIRQSIVRSFSMQSAR